MAVVGVAVDGLDVTEELSTEKASSSVDETEGGQDELAYADAMEEWVITLTEKSKEGQQQQAALSQIPGSEPLTLIKLAARCQHLERFATPRNTFPEGKAGYLQWRRSLYTIQADKASALLLEAGLSEQEAKVVHTWVSKTDLKPGKEGGEWGTQVLEDAAVLVFLQDQLHHFASQHPGYTREKTWRKLSEDGKQAALGLQMPGPLKSIIEEATRNPATTVMAQTHMDRERDLDDFSAKWNSRGVTQSQKDEVAKNQAYRNNLNDVNAKWQADSQNKLNNGQQPDQFPDVPPPDSKAPTA
ncbi:hypothetical protein L7F22_019604 [Adiantum nelumboides]|nr:hypothetical protein [Adiantum nelumboides]